MFRAILNRIAKLYVLSFLLLMGCNRFYYFPAPVNQGKIYTTYKDNDTVILKKNGLLVKIFGRFIGKCLFFYFSIANFSDDTYILTPDRIQLISLKTEDAPPFEFYGDSSEPFLRDIPYYYIDDPSKAVNKLSYAKIQIYPHGIDSYSVCYSYYYTFDHTMEFHDISKIKLIMKFLNIDKNEEVEFEAIFVREG